MCYSATHMSESVGVRELRQNLSRYLERVKAGEALVVTEHGRHVARLIPSGTSGDRYAELGDSGTAAARYRQALSVNPDNERALTATDRLA